LSSPPVRFPEDPRFTAGVREFNARHFYEAHEIWEDLWNELVGDEKRLCQGLIQIAVGYHKLSLGGISGACKLLDRGLRLLQRSGQMAAVVEAVQVDLDLLRTRPAEAGRVSPPRIEE